MRRAAVLAVVLLAAGSPAAGAATWVPDDGDWSHFRRAPDHAGATSARGAFAPDAAELRVKWRVDADPGYWVPPVAADLDGDGVAEVVATVGNASANPGPPPTLNLVSGVRVLDGRTGALRWQVGPTTGNLVFFSPTLGDVDADGQGDVVFLDGNPLTGTFATNKIHAYSHAGQKKWEWSDTAWGQKVPLPLNALAIGNVDGESARSEVVADVVLAKVDVGVDGSTVVLTMSQPEQRLVALNGEGAGSVSWQRTFPNASLSTPSLADFDDDGVLDVAWGSGVRSGRLVDEDEIRLELSEAFEGHTVRVLGGGAVPSTLLAQEVDRFPGEQFVAALADLDADGRVDIIHQMNDPGAIAAVRGMDIQAMRDDGSEMWRQHIRAAGIASLAVADLDGDGQPEVVLQTTGAGDSDVRRRVIALRPDGTQYWSTAQFPRNLDSFPAVGDITGDGHPEVLVILGGSPGPYLIALEGTSGAELFRYDLASDLDATGAPVLADLDGDDDGRLEILVNLGEWGSPGTMLALEPELPDLRVAGLAFGAAEHALGVPETVTATVTNAGSRAAVGAVVAFWEDSEVLATETVDLAAGASTTVTATWTPAQAGARTVRAVADPGKAVAEWVETDNAQERSVHVRAADLAFDAGDPGFSDARPAENSTITVHATLRNLGDRDAAGVVVQVTRDGAVVASQELGILAAGAAKAVSAEVPVGLEGSRTVAVVADPGGVVPESDEANNRAARALDVRFVGPDLSFAGGDPVFSDPSPTSGDTISVSVTLRNAGERDAPASVVRFLDDGAPFAERAAPALAAGQEAELSAALDVRGDHAHRIRVLADPDGGLREQREDDNEASKLLQVRFLGPDLAFEAGDPAFSDPNPGAGDTLEVRVTVRNVGNRSSPASVARFLDDGAVFAELPVPALAAGDRAQLTASLLAQGVRDHAIEVRADPAEQLAEEREDNNAAGATLTVSFLAPDLRVGSVALSDANPDELDTLTLTVTVRNDGSPGRAARDVVVRVLDQGALAASAVLDAVPSGEARDAALAYVVRDVGARSLAIEVDPANATWELDEANNAASARVVVGKLRVTVAMDGAPYTTTDPARGAVSVAFRNTGRPLAGHEFALPVEIAAALPPGAQPLGEQLAGFAAALVAQAEGFSHDHLRVCVAGTCVSGTVDQAGELARLLGAGAAAGLAGAEVTVRVATLELRTNRAGVAAFEVPFDLPGAADAVRGAARAEACAGEPLAGALDAALAAAGQPALGGCVRQAPSSPAPPPLANLPGEHRATAALDWHGFGFAGRAAWEHVPAPPAVPEA